MILALALCLSAAAILAWLIFSLAVYALPVAAGASASALAYHSGASIAGAAVVGLIIGAMAYAIGQVAMENVRSPAARLALLLLYVAPAGFAGSAIVYGIAVALVPSPAWQAVLAGVGGVVVAASAWARMTAIAPPGRPGGVGGIDTAQLRA